MPAGRRAAVGACPAWCPVGKARAGQAPHLRVMLRPALDDGSDRLHAVGQRHGPLFDAGRKTGRGGACPTWCSIGKARAGQAPHLRMTLRPALADRGDRLHAVGQRHGPLFDAGRNTGRGGACPTWCSIDKARAGQAPHLRLTMCPALDDGGNRLHAVGQRHSPLFDAGRKTGRDRACPAWCPVGKARAGQAPHLRVTLCPALDDGGNRLYAVGQRHGPLFDAGRKTGRDGGLPPPDAPSAKPVRGKPRTYA